MIDRKIDLRQNEKIRLDVDITQILKSEPSLAHFFLKPSSSRNMLCITIYNNPSLSLIIHGTKKRLALPAILVAHSNTLPVFNQFVRILSWLPERLPTSLSFHKRLLTNQ